MRVSYKVNENCTIDAEVKDTKGAFEFIAYSQSLFSVRQCGNCDSPHLSLQHRQPQGYNYYSVKCDDCGHELKFGQQRDAPHHLFPKGWEPPYEGEGGGSRRDAQPAGVGADSGDDIGF